MKYLFKLLKSYKKECVLAPLFKMLEAIFDLIVPLVVAKIIDVGILTKNSSFILSHFGILLLMAILGLLCSFTAQFFAAKAAIGTSKKLRRKLLSHIQSLSFSDRDKIGTSTLITRMTADVNQVQNGVNMFLRLFLRSPFIVFGSMLLAFRIDFHIALVFVAVIIVLFIIVFGIMLITNPLYKRVQENLDEITVKTRESLSGVRVIRAFGREQTELNDFYASNSHLNKSQIKVGRISALMNPLTYVVINIGIILVLWLGAGQVNNGALLSGNVVALINYLSQILIELVKLASFVILMSKSIASMDRIGSVLDVKSSMSYGELETKKSSAKNAVMFKNVSLSYNAGAKEALSDISFSIAPGETVGIIGGTGSGKSSIVSLIARFYDATAGSIYIMDEKISAWSQRAIRNTVTVVMQKPQLFSGTIKSNLLYGKKDASEEEMWKALELAQAADFVRSKDKMLDARVEQGGRNFSGGQKQRLTIARALISNPDILILDDSSSALDYATDAALRKAISTLSDSLTVIIVSQRTSSIRHADKILVLDDGRLEGCGTHAELLKDCAVYREIHESTGESI